MQDYANTIIFIGPMSAGKSTVGKLVAEQLGIPQIAVDDYRWDYYDEIGYDRVRGKAIAETEGMVGLLRYWKPFEAHTVERMLQDHTRCVIDFGAGHSVYEDEALFARVQAVLAPYPYVILLLPSPDLDESTRILNQRFSELLEREVGHVDPELLKVNEHFVKHHSNHTLAKQVFYTQGQTPEATCAAVLAAILPDE